MSGAGTADRPSTPGAGAGNPTTIEGLPPSYGEPESRSIDLVSNEQPCATLGPR
jgi:hypothetical protein